MPVSSSDQYMLLLPFYCSCWLVDWIVEWSDGSDWPAATAVHKTDSREVRRRGEVYLVLDGPHFRYI